MQSVLERGEDGLVRRQTPNRSNRANLKFVSYLASGVSEKLKFKRSIGHSLDACLERRSSRLRRRYIVAAFEDAIDDPVRANVPPDPFDRNGRTIAVMIPVTLRGMVVCRPARSRKSTA